MNSEELELSLRTEFESYLKNVLADVRQEVSDFQEKFEAEFEKHKSQLNDVFRNFSERIENGKEMDEVFKESVVEHLRLARDEGARITASAIAEAEQMRQETDAAEFVPDYTQIKDAISDISSQDSQSAILKSLVNHAANFTPRGAFFIIKNEHFVGWRVFGKEAEMEEQAVREVFFPMSNETLLSASVRSLSAVESGYGTYSDDSLYLNKLEFGQPDKMYAIPLVARGRGVAVLYADYGTKGAKVNVEALETMVRVAGLTVELLAASQGAKNAAVSSGAAQNDYAAEAQPQVAEKALVGTPTVESYQPAAESYAPAAVADNYGTTYAGEETAFSAGSYDQKDFARTDFAADNFSTQNDFSAAEERQNTAENYGGYGFEKSADNSFSYDANEAKPTDNAFSYDTATGYQSEKVEAEPNFQHEPAEDSASVESEGEKAVEADVEPANSYSWNQPVESSNGFGGNYAAPDEQRDEPAASYEQKDYSFEAPAAESEKTEEPSSFEAEKNFSFDAAPAYDAAPQTSETSYKSWEAPAETTQYEAPQPEPEHSFESYKDASTDSNFAAAPSAAAPVEAQPAAKNRLSDRNVDLPIEVADEERRHHNDARRFARLLVSEIKLYNEQKVKEGRDSADLYDRLREAIDRSREMYDKRVQAPVASKFDYFHYELVSNLAEGNENLLGSGYPGANV